jgi:hypothetical protein
MDDFTSRLPAQTGPFSSQFQFVQPDPLWFRPKPKQPTPQELAAALAAEEEKAPEPAPQPTGPSPMENYMADLRGNPSYVYNQPENLWAGMMPQAQPGAPAPAPTPAQGGATPNAQPDPMAVYRYNQAMQQAMAQLDAQRQV